MIPLVWDGGEHPFRLGIGELRALQQSTGVGPLFLMGRIVGSQWFVDDIIETIRLGLIGGKSVTETQAKQLVDKVFTGEQTEPIYRHAILATRILRDAVMGDPNDPVGETDDEGETKAGNSSS